MNRQSVFFLILISIAAMCAMARAEEGTDGEKRILVVHSYHETQKGHVVEMTEGIEEALKGSGAEVRYFHMDTKRRTGLRWKRRAGEIAGEILAEYAPHVVITMDDNAQAYFARRYAGKAGAPPFVFGGVDARPGKYGFPAENVTGVIERPNIKESIELLRKIVPGVRKVALLSDKSPTTDPFCAYAATLDLPVEVVACEQVSTLSQWKAAIEKYEKEVDAFGIYVIRTIRRSTVDPVHVPESELVDLLIDRTRLPAAGFFDSSARAGLLCGISVSMKEQGFAAARIAREILDGRKPDDFEVAPTTRGRILLNLSTAEKLGIRIRYQTIKRAEEVIR